MNTIIHNNEDIDIASWAFMSVTEADVSFPEARELMKSIISKRDNKIWLRIKEYLKPLLEIALDKALHFKVNDTHDDTIAAYEKWKEETINDILCLKS